MRRGQSASEYLVMVAGVIFVAVFLFLMLKGELLPGAAGRTRNSSRDFVDEYGKAYSFYDNFDSSSLNRWKNVIRPDWSIQNGVLDQAMSSSGDLPLTVGDTTWQNYAITADIFLKTGYKIGVVARYSADSPYFYLCGLDNKPSGSPPTLSAKLLLCNTQYPRGDHCFVMSMGNSVPAVPNAWYKVNFKVDGPSLTCKVDNSVVSVVNYNAEFGAPGIFGNSYGGKFDNFKVAKLPPSTAFQAAPTPLVIQNPACAVIPEGIPLGTQQILRFTWQTPGFPSDGVAAFNNHSTGLYSVAYNFTTLTTNHRIDKLIVSWISGNTYYFTVQSSNNGFYVESNELACIPNLP